MNEPVIVVAVFGDGEIDPSAFFRKATTESYAVAKVTGYRYEAPEIIFDVQGSSFRARLVFNRLTLLWVLTELEMIEAASEAYLAAPRQGAL